MRPSALVTGRGGLGDAIFARPFVREALRTHEQVFVSTSWPWAFSDLPVRPVKRVGGLAVQAYHGELCPADSWSEAPAGARVISLRYRWRKIARGISVQEEMESVSGLSPAPGMDLPPLPASPIDGQYAVVRPPAIRLDYPAPAREPVPEYLSAASIALRARGYRVVTLGAFVPGLEEPNGSPVPADVRFEHGELSVPQAFALVAGAAVVVSAPCWLVPACTASGTPLVVIAGGCGGRNNPNALVDRRLLADHVTWLLPDRYCRCTSRHHRCPKSISGFTERLSVALDGAATRMAA